MQDFLYFRHISDFPYRKMRNRCANQAAYPPRRATLTQTHRQAGSTHSYMHARHSPSIAPASPSRPLFSRWPSVRVPPPNEVQPVNRRRMTKIILPATRGEERGTGEDSSREASPAQQKRGGGRSEGLAGRAAAAAAGDRLGEQALK